jgi:phage anti-repressor protein
MTTQDFNIVELIENNPITKLSKEYNSKLLNKIKETFTDFEQQLFLSSFYCYLNYDKITDYVVDLDDIWKWLDFSTKQKSLRLLENNFILNVDYINKNSLNQLVKRDIKTHGGQNKEKYMLNINSFKKICLKAGTKKASEIHDYYIKLEKILQEILEEETNELRLQLEQKDTIITTITQNTQRAIEETLINQFPLNTECIYFGTINNTNENNETLIKFGHTNNLHVRVQDHRKNYNNFVLVDAFKVQNKVEIENLIKTYPKIKKQIRTIEVNGKNKTEIIAYDQTTFTINKLTKYIKEIIHSKVYSIDNYNKIMKQNEKLLHENEDLKKQLKIYEETINRQKIEIVQLNEQIILQKNTLQMVEDEATSVYQNELLPDDEQTTSFNEFINTMCLVRPDVEESSTNMEGAYRIWNKTKPKKEIFHAFKTYLDTRFKPSRISHQNKNQVVHGYIGVKLIMQEYKKKYSNNDVETFLFEVCLFKPSGKMLNSTLLSEYQRWKQQLNKPTNNDDMKHLKDYLNNCECVLKATVWTDKGANEGYYGILLKADEYKHKTTSSTGKIVEKMDVKTGQVLRTWDTIAKAAEDEGFSAAKMSRSIKNKTIFNDDYYYK